MHAVRSLLLGSLLWITACQTTSELRMERVEAIALSFRPQESLIEKTCEVSVDLSGPTEEKYRRSFPEESAFSEPVHFKWEILGRRCQLTPIGEANEKWQKNHGVVVKAAFCTLLQGFVIESPFAGLSLLAADIQKGEGEAEEWVQILGVQSRKPVLEIHEQDLKLRVVSNQNQIFQASYEKPAESKKPTPRIEDIRMEAKDFTLEVSEFAFQNFSNGEISSVFPREIKKLSIFTKDANALEPSLYATAHIIQCQ